MRARDEARAWKRCGRRPLRGDPLCASHRDAIDSAVLGILELDQRAMAEKRIARKSSPCVGHAKSCGGKSRRPSGSNRTRLERVPLPIGGEGLERNEGVGFEQTQRAGGDMPFIGGRYYANALAGHAIEAACEPEAASSALKQKNKIKANAVAAAGNDADAGDEDQDESSAAAVNEGKAPIHRVEIEAAELVPAHSGRAQRGFVARVHRDTASGGDASGGAQAPAPGQLPLRGYAAKPETHVFAGHGDLLDFLKNELQNKTGS